MSLPRRTTLLSAVPLVLACVGGLLLSAHSPAKRAPLLKLKPLAGTFPEPVEVTTAPGQKNVLFVAEQQGRVVALRKGKKLKTPFLDIRSLVGFDNFGAEPGFLSIVFSPNYVRNRRFFVAYTDNAGNIRVDGFLRSKRHALTAQRSSRKLLLDIPHPDQDPFQRNHYAGQMDFDTGGNLLLSTGDGGGGGDPGENAQDTGSLLGKLLRIRPKPVGHSGYSVPKTNPFVHRSGRDEIYSVGFRNPWRFELRRPGRDQLVLGDVGQNLWEEIDLVTLKKAKGANFGWDDLEGTHPYEPIEDPPVYTPPLYEYAHGGDSGACAISSVSFANGIGVSRLEHAVLFADFCAGQLQALIPHDTGPPDLIDTGVDVSLPTSISRARGDLYLASLEGKIYRIGPAG